MNLTENVSPYVFPGLKNKDDVKRVKKFKRDRITQDEVLSIISEHCNVSVHKILSRIREREVIDARHMFIAVMRKEFNYPLTEIGKMVDRDHTTIMDSMKKFNSRYDCYDDYREVADGIFTEIKLKID